MDDVVSPSAIVHRPTSEAAKHRQANSRHSVDALSKRVLSLSSLAVMASAADRGDRRERMGTGRRAYPVLTLLILSLFVLTNCRFLPGQNRSSGSRPASSTQVDRTGALTLQG